MNNSIEPVARRFAAHPSTWLLSFAVIVGLGAILPAIYLSSTIDPQRHLDGFPIALVVQPQTVDGPVDSAAALARGIETNTDPEKFDLERLSPAELKKKMSNGKIYGAVVIPSNFNEAIMDASSPTPKIELPTVEVRTNTRIGGVSSALFTGNVLPVVTGSQRQLGQQLISTAVDGGTQLTPAQTFILGSPFSVVTLPYEPLPEGTGLGTSTFYYSLLLVLLGFLGASTVHPTVDSAIGFAPNEVGPLVSRRPYRAVSRRFTLLIKMAVMLIAAPVAAAVTQLVAGPVLGMPIAHGVELWLFASASIIAIGWSALSVFAIFGNIGALINMVFFIALAMTSSGGTVPIEATPAFFQWIARFEPMHAILQGVKSILYYGANGDSGLTEAWVRTGLGALLGVAIGLGATARFDKSPKLTRHPSLVVDEDAVNLVGAKR